MDIYKNPVAQQAKTPALSVLIPYYHDDPADLLTALNGRDDIEILLYDDGTGDQEINENLRKLAADMPLPITLFFAQNNKGRSSARNTLKENAAANWVLFLDADMLPQTDTFIADYLHEISKNTADIIFGGFTVPSQKQSTDTELHRKFSMTSDCLSAEDRTKNGPQYVCSSNLCVRAHILDECGFDPSFTGWGWEDSEWAARVAKSYTILHADIPALHLGLENTETLLTRFKTSGANYVKFTEAHPELAKTLTLYKMSTAIKHLPGQKLMRPLLAGFVRASILPIKLRLIALKLWRASWYAEAFT
ncbi:MAG: glycosyl transferase [Robiginitomaculum sp.]|nr:MAG: glycosyl transferase [Robiginitomaculum sp.]